MYPSDLTDEQWQLVRGHLEYNNGYGNRAKYSRRVLLNAIFYIVKTGAQWRSLPKRFPNWQTVYSYFRRLSLAGKWKKLLVALVKKKIKK